MELFTYDVNSRQKLYVGRETDHRTKAIRFSGFKKSEPENAVYLKLDAPIGKMIPLTDDYAVEVTQLLTDKARDIRCQLVEMHEEEDGKYSFIRNSAIFYASVAVSVPMSELAEVTDPRLELAYQMMYQGYVRMTENGQLLMDEYQEIKEAFDSGALNGKDGYTPQKGVDYFDGEDGKDGADGYTPQKGIDYFDGKDGKDGADGYTPIKGVDYFDGKDGINGKDGARGEKGDPGYTPQKGVDYFDGRDGVDGKDGAKGEKGDPGDDGFSPSITVTAIPGGHNVRIITKAGSVTFDVLDGEDGKDGGGVSDDHINSLIDAKLGVIENGSY